MEDIENDEKKETNRLGLKKKYLRPMLYFVCKNKNSVNSVSLANYLVETCECDNTVKIGSKKKSLIFLSKSRSKLKSDFTCIFLHECFRQLIKRTNNFKLFRLLFNYTHIYLILHVHSNILIF